MTSGAGNLTVGEILSEASPAEGGIWVCNIRVEFESGRSELLNSSLEVI